MSKFLFCIFLTVTSLFAHKVNLFVTQDKNAVEIYSYFASGDACKACKLIIKNNDVVLLEDRLNDEGKYVYNAQENSLNIIVDASSGHLVEKEFTLNTMQEDNLEVVLKEEKENQFFKIILSLVFIGVFFYGLKRFKKNAK